METMRRAIENGTFDAEHREFQATYRPVSSKVEPSEEQVG
jgi:hypothetical protein